MSSIRNVFFTSALSSFALAHYLPRYSVNGSTALTFLALLSVGLTWILIYQSQIWPKLLSPIRKLPQAPGGTFWNGQFARILKEDMGVPMREWVNTVPNEGLIRYTAALNAERILLTSPKALSEVLVTKCYDFEKPSDTREALGRILGFGVLLAEGDEHKRQRKHLSPAFAYRHVKELVPTFWSKSAEMVRAIDEQYGKGLDSTGDGMVVMITDWLTRCTLDIIGIAGMGYDFNAIHDPNSELNLTYRSLFSPNKQARNLQILAQFIPPWLVRLIPIARNTEVASGAATIRKVSRDVIREKQRKLSDSEKGAVLGRDIISVALESGGFSEDNLVDQVMTFLAAGHETTSTAMTWALLELARHPDIQAELREEVCEHFPSSTDETATVTSELLDRMHYLHAVCNEVLRFHPPVPITRRHAVRDTTILGTPVVKGTNVFLVPAAINKSRELWGEDAEEFKPNRWLGKNANSGGAASNFALLTFLHGPHSCIGQKFSQMEFACLLAAIVGHYSFELHPKDRIIEVQSGVTVSPKGGLELRMKKVEGW